MSAQKATAKLLADAVLLIEERLQDMAARHLRDWDGPTSYLVIEEHDIEAREALQFIARYGRKANVYVSATAVAS